MTLYIKNMVCNRCKMVVKTELEKLGIQPLTVELGEVELPAELSDAHKEQVQEALQPLGFANASLQVEYIPSPILTVEPVHFYVLLIAVRKYLRF